MGILSRIKQEIIYALSAGENARCKELCKDLAIAGRYKRVYFYHIRKCGGTSLTQAFLALSGSQPTQELYDRLCKKPNYRLINGGKVYVGFNQKLLEEGNYFYGFSQIPLYELSLPPDTFTVVSLRDPVARVFSHYKMINELKMNKDKHPVLPVEGKWVGKNFSDFLERIPRRHLLRDVYMFSKTYDPQEAFENIAHCSYYYFVEDLAEAMKEMSARLNTGLRPLHARKGGIKMPLPEAEYEQARRTLEPSYALMEKLKKYASAAGAAGRP